MQPEIICFGEPLMELNQAEGGDHYLAGHGGDTSNCAIAAARQGARVGYLTALGADGFGQSFLDLWAREGVDHSRVLRKAEAQTGIYFVSHGQAGHSFSYRRAGSAASRITPEEVPEDYIAGAQILHVSGISQAISDSACDAVFHAIAIARENGVKVSYDPNLRLQLWPLDRARAVIHGAMASCHIALPGLDDARLLTGLEAPEAIADFYLSLGAEIVVLTLGPDGALVATGGERRQIPGRKVAAVDATAAGDTFDGAFLAEYLRGADPFRAAAYANGAAALSTQGYGAVAPMPGRAEVTAFLERTPP
jgi:2-dehydro-3-deoxygluconokinase